MAKSRSGPTGTGFCRPKSVSKNPISAPAPLPTPQTPDAPSRWGKGPGVRSSVVVRALHLLLHRLQAPHALLRRGVRREERGNVVTTERRHDKKGARRLRLAEIAIG